VIGKYDHCAFAVPGTGIFRPLEGSRPKSGRVGKMERVREIRLETVVDESRWQSAVEGARAVHPYEEMAWDLYPLQPRKGAGLGRIGKVPAVSFGDLATRAAEAFGANVRVMGRPPRLAHTVACVPGSGGGLLGEAAALGAQVLVTGELRYHQMTEAEHLGVGVIEVGHDRSEMPAVDLLASALRKAPRLRAKGLRVHVYRRPRSARPL